MHKTPVCPSVNMEIDETDLEIIRMLQADARQPLTAIAEELDLASATIHSRLNRLVEEDVIQGYHTEINPAAVGMTAQALVGFRLKQGYSDEAHQLLRDHDNIVAVHMVSSRWDLVAEVFAEDINALRDLLFDDITEMDVFSRSEVMIVLETDYEVPNPPI